MTAIRFVERDQTPAPEPVVLIISSAYNSLPAPGNRVGPSDAANMPTIRALNDSDGRPAIQSAVGAHHYRLVGLNIESAASFKTINLVQIGGGETSVGQFPTDITVDRCVVRNVNDTAGGRRGVQMDAIRGAVIDSYIYNFKEDGGDTQAVWAYNTPGPLKFVNNYLEAAGENIMFGGANPAITDVAPADIEIRRNYIYKPLSWVNHASSWDIKNHMELKTGSRVLFEGNVCENNWAGNGQNGESILVSPKDHAAWTRSDDVTLRYNKFVNVGMGILAAGRDVSTTIRSSRVTIKHNLLDITGLNGAVRRMFEVFNTATDVQIEHNTGFINVTNAGATVVLESNSPGYKNVRFVFRDNICSSDFYGVIGSGSAIGTDSLDTHCASWTFTNNALIGGSGYTYPANTWYPTSTSTVGFEDFAGGDYRLDPTSSYYAGAANDATDGTDLGADIATLNTKTANTVTGAWNDESTYTDSAYTNAEMPREYINTTYHAQAGNLWTVTSSSNGSVPGTGDGNRTDCSFAYALANCAVGDTVSVLYTLTLTGPFTLRNI